MLLFSLFFSFTLVSQNEKENTNIFTNTADAAKLVIAKQKMLAGDYVAALNSFREIVKNSPNDATLRYYVAFCYFNLKQYDKAKEELLKALAINKDVKPETHLLLGKVYQVEQDFDKAIEQLNSYKAFNLSDKDANMEADVALSQCQNAKSYMANPLNVTVTNMGEKINSKYDDKNPCITADSKKMVFTTRRPETTADLVDVEGDGKYFENIYIAVYDSTTKDFGKAVNIGAPVNTKAHDACTSISADGKQIFVYKNDIHDNASRGGNVFYSNRINNGKWKKPETIGKPINSSYWEGGACISTNGRTYFFSSERPGGYGGSDIWMVEKISKKEWGKPVNLGPQINTPYDEAGMFLAPDGKTLFFCSNGPLSMGSYDVLKTVNENGVWSTPVNIGYPINTPGREGQLTVSADARYAYISSDRKGGLGENDIYRVELKDYAILEKDGRKTVGNGLSILRGTIREGFEGYGLPDVEVQLKDASGNVVATAFTNETGEYLFALRGGQYTISISKKGFKEITEPVNLALSDKETVVLEKGYLLKK